MKTYPSERPGELIDFIQRLVVPSGLLAGRTIELLPFQRQIINALYGKNRPRQSVISLPRKNGKTTLLAGIILGHLIGPLKNDNDEIYSAAADRDQASIIYRMIEAFLRYDKSLSAMVHFRRSERSIENKQNGTIYRALSADVGGKHGLNASLIVCDELAQWRGRELFDVLATSQGARVDPLLVAISTQAVSDNHIMSQLIDYGLSYKGHLDKNMHCYVATTDKDWTTPEAWVEANPAAGTFRDLSELKTACEQAQANPAAESPFRNLYLNQRVATYNSLVPRSVWDAAKAEQQPVAGPCLVGLDVPSWDSIGVALLWLDHNILEGVILRGKKELSKYFMGLDVVEVVASRTVHHGLDYILDGARVHGVDFTCRGLSPGVRQLKDDLTNGMVKWMDNTHLDMSYSNVILETDSNGDQRPIRADEGASGEIAAQPLVAAIALSVRAEHHRNVSTSLEVIEI